MDYLKIYILADTKISAMQSVAVTNFYLIEKFAFLRPRKVFSVVN